MTDTFITAVVVAWNAGSTLNACVSSLRESAILASVGLNVIVIDNNSVDDSVTSLPLRSADRVVCNPVNAGFGVAASQGIALADAPWVMLINPDVVVDRMAIPVLAAAARAATSDVATLIPELRFTSDPSLINCRGVTMDAAGIPAEIDAGTRGVPERESALEALGGSSGCCLLRLEALRTLGGIEPCFFAYLEDVDLAVRLRAAGFRALAVPEAVAWHEGSATTGEGSPLKTYLVARNRRILFRLDGPRSVEARFWRSVIETGHAVVSTRQPAVAAPWLGRLGSLRLRLYTRFVIRSRRLTEPTRSPLSLPDRVGLRATLARKRRIEQGINKH